MEIIPPALLVSCSSSHEKTRCAWNALCTIKLPKVVLWSGGVCIHNHGTVFSLKPLEVTSRAHCQLMWCLCANQKEDPQGCTAWRLRHGCGFRPGSQLEVVLLLTGVLGLFNQQKLGRDQTRKDQDFKQGFTGARAAAALGSETSRSHLCWLPEAGLVSSVGWGWGCTCGLGWRCGLGGLHMGIVIFHFL